MGLRYGFEPLASVPTLITHLRQLLKVTGDLTLVPREEDLLDIRKYV